MNLKQLFADEDAVSPVIGVILMVAITVILAAVIGTFVLGLGENVQDSAPQANFQFEYDDGATAGFGDSEAESVSITHTGGEDITRSTLSVSNAGTTIYDSGSGSGSFTATTNWADPVATGETVELEATDGSLSGGNTIRVIWTSPSGGTSNTIGQSEVPS